MSEAGLAQTATQRATLLTRLLDGWTPDIDDRRNEKPGIISGRNFRDTLDGPASAWANEYVNFNQFDSSSRAKITELRITRGFLYGTPTGVYKINTTSGMLEPLLTTPDITVTQIYWPWTIAYVGGKYYLAQYDIGLWEYDDVNETLTKLSTPMGNNVRFITANHGRLVAFNATHVGYSSLDNGRDFVPSLSTGAGAQELSMVGGTPHRIENVTDGFLVFMTKGIMKGNWTTAAYVFTFTKHSESVKTFSPNANVNVPGLGVLALDSNGFWLTKEYNYETYGYPQPWDVEKSDYIKKNILIALDENLHGTILMYYSNALQMLFVAFASNLLQGLYQTTFCWDMVSKRWSSLDFPHYGILETYDALTNRYTCSYVDTDGFMHAFKDQNFSEDVPEYPTVMQDFVYRPQATDDIVRVVTDSARNAGVAFEQGNTEILVSNDNPLAYTNYTISSVYTINAEPFSDTMNPEGDPDMDVSVVPIMGYTNMDMFSSGGIELYAVPQILPSKSLDSYIVLGFWRFNTQTNFAEEQSFIESLMLAINNVVGFEIYEDWNELTGSEDWNSLSGAEDWSFGSAFPNIFQVSLFTVNDGWSTPLQGEESLEVFNDMGTAKLYKPMGWNGIYHSIKISADNVSDCYNIKVVDITANLSGIPVY